MLEQPPLNTWKILEKRAACRSDFFQPSTKEVLTFYSLQMLSLSSVAWRWDLYSTSSVTPGRGALEQCCYWPMTQCNPWELSSWRLASLNAYMICSVASPLSLVLSRTRKEPSTLQGICRRASAFCLSSPSNSQLRTQPMPLISYLQLAISN